MPGMDLGIDLGTCQIVIYASDRGVVLCEPSVIAIDAADGHLIACGTEAYQMIGRTPDSILVVQPLRKGVISEYDYAEQMLRYFIRKVCSYKIIKPRAAVSIPASVTEVEQRSVWEAVSASGIRHVTLIEEAVAAAIGAGLDISAPHGSLVVDIGGGTTDVAVMTLQGVATSSSIRLGGNDVDEAIIRFVRARYNMVIGSLMAETIKKQIGRAVPTEENAVMRMRGRDALTGLPRTQEISSLDVDEAITDVMTDILAAVQKVLENTPPELISDILDGGIHLTGGMALLQGLEKRLEAQTGIACRVAENPEHCVAIGAGKVLRYTNKLHSGVYDVGQFAYHLSDSLDI